MSLSFNGLGSGIAISDIVTALVSAEQTPFESRLNTKESTLTTDISAVGALKSALEKVQESMGALGDEENYQKRTISGNDSFLSLSSDKKAQPGGYSVKVNNLATEHKIMSKAFSDTEAVGKGVLTLSSGNASFDIDVSSTATLAEVQDAINDSKDNKNINATIITDSTGQHLVFSSKNTGIANEIKIEVNDDDANNTDTSGLSRLAFDSAGVKNVDEITAAQDASITIDGTLSATSSSNTFADVINGVTITVKKAHDSTNINDISTLSVTENNNNISAGLNGFIDSYNELLELSNNLGASGEDGVGVMAGDSLLRGVMSKLRQQITEEIDMGGGKTLSLAQLGVSTDRYGVLSLDSQRLSDEISSDVDLVQQFFLGDDGLAKSFDDFMGFYTDAGGLIENRIDSKKDQLLDIDDERISFARKMQALETRLFAQYNSMDLLVANLNATSNYVQAQLENMPGVVRSNN